MDSSEAPVESVSAGYVEPEIRLRVRFALWAAAWAIAIFSTAGVSLQRLLFVWLFPYGLLGLFSPTIWDPPEFSVVVFGWAFYLALTVCGIAQRKRFRYFVAYTVLLIFLVLNVAGCHVQLRHPWFKMGGC